MRSTVSWKRVVALMVLSAMGGLWSLPVHGAEIRLFEEAFIKGSTITLGEVATIAGDDAGNWTDVDLGPAAAPGSSRQLGASLVEARLRSAGLNREDFQVTGARAVRATTLHRVLSKEQIAESLREHIWAEMPWQMGETDIEIPLPMSEETLPEGQVEIQWRTNPQYRYVGAGAFRGKISVDGEVQKTLVLRAVVESYGDVVVAAGDVSRGRPLGPNDIKLEKHALSRLPRGAIMDPKEIDGLIARRSLFTGQVLTTQHVEAPRIVQRNQVVAVEMATGGLRVQSRARAMSDGRAGDLIRLANLHSKEQFQGIVRKDGVVVVE